MGGYATMIGHQMMEAGHGKCYSTIKEAIETFAA